MKAVELENYDTIIQNKHCNELITKETLKGLKPYPPQVLKLATNIGFIEEFYQQCKQHANSRDAFDFLNDLHADFFGRPKYADYHTFKNIRNRLNQKFCSKSK